MLCLKMSECSACSPLHESSHFDFVTSLFEFCIWQDDNFLSSLVKEREEELTKKTLESLNEMRIKFPGKTDSEAELLLDKVQVYLGTANTRSLSTVFYAEQVDFLVYYTAMHGLLSIYTSS